MSGGVVKFLIVLFYSIFATSNINLYANRRMTFGELFVENVSFLAISVTVLSLNF